LPKRAFHIIQEHIVFCNLRGPFYFLVNGEGGVSRNTKEFPSSLNVPLFVTGLVGGKKKKPTATIYYSL
jgi:hypothetical protein